MKKGNFQKTSIVKDDENYLEGINLVTGDKIDYNKHLLSETQVSSLCINEKLSKIDKFTSLIVQGEKIQKWSIFQNLTLYIEDSVSAEKIFVLLQKNYDQYEQFMNILGEGLLKYLKKSVNQPEIFNKKCYDMIYRLLHRTITSAKHQGSSLLQDWMLALSEFFHLPDNNSAVNNKQGKLAEMKQYINGSFSMNTLPERRKTALQMINALVGESQEIQKHAHSKILFFNNDLNPATRLVICRIIEKSLKIQPNNPELWKCLSDYYLTDKSMLIKEKSFRIMSQNYYSPNFQFLIQELDCQEAGSSLLISKNAPILFKTFSKQIQSQKNSQTKIISYLNRLLRNNMEQNLSKVVQCYSIIANSIQEEILAEELQLKKFDLQNLDVLTEIISLYNVINNIEFKQQIKRQILKGVRFHEFNIKGDHLFFKNLLEVLQMNVDEQINIFILLFSKQIQNSKWKNIQLFLSKIYQIKFYQSQYQKIGNCILKIYNNCPYFLLEEIHEVILFLLLNDRKNMDIFSKIKQKFLNSRCWIHRRNYIKLYAFFKINASYEFNKSIPVFIYKNILNEKNSLIKYQFVNQIQNAYSYIDPSCQQEKNSIKETISRLIQDKDKDLSELSQANLQKIIKIEKDYQISKDRLIRNQELVIKEHSIDQVQSEVKKHIKSQKIIFKSSKQSKIKKQLPFESKASANLLRQSNNMEKKKMGLLETNNILRSSSTQQKLIAKIITPSIKKSKF